MTRRILCSLLALTGACVEPLQLDPQGSSTAGESSTTIAADESSGGAITPEQTCADYCDRANACEGEDTACVQDCLDNLAVYDGVDAACDAATEQFVACIATLTSCDYQPCAVAGLASDECEMLYGCDVDMGGEVGSSACTWNMSCGVFEGPRHMRCDDVTCTCELDGEAIGDCDAPPDVCTHEFPAGYVTDCCGWLDPFGQPI